MSRPYFTIITPVLNRQDDIKRMIRNVKEQDFTDFELIIIDNGSSDGTYEYCLGQIDNQTKVIQCKERGLAFARNAGIKIASGEWITLLDSDNLFYDSQTLSKLWDLIKQYKDAIGFFTYCDDDQGNQIAHLSVPNTNKYITLYDYLNHMKGEFSCVVRTEWFKKNLYPEIKGAVTEFPFCVWFKLVLTNKVVVSDLKTQIYGTNSEGRICSDKVNDQRAMELTDYYYMLLDRFGNEILQNSIKTYFTFLLKVVIYNNISKRYKIKDFKNFRFFTISLPLNIIPKSISRYCVEAYKA